MVPPTLRVPARRSLTRVRGMRILEAAQIFCDGYVFTTKMAAHSSAALSVQCNTNVSSFALLKSILDEY